MCRSSATKRPFIPLALLLGFADASWAAQLVAHCKMDEAGAPFAEMSGALSLGLDFNTTATQAVVGADGGAARQLTRLLALMV